MPYELAKQLMDAGLPSGKADEYISTGPYEQWMYPTLEELIEVCEEKGQLLLGCYGRGKYTARVGYFIEPTSEQEAAGYPQISAHIAVESPTLIEAVAHLWLALNSPNQETK